LLHPKVAPEIAEEGPAVMSTINRNTGTHQPVSTRQASTGPAHLCMVLHAMDAGAIIPAAFDHKRLAPPVQ
jgi:hypothetical protein